MIGELESLATSTNTSTNYYSQQDTSLPLPSDLLRSIRKVEKKLSRTEKHEIPADGGELQGNNARSGKAADEGEPKYSTEWCRLQRRLGGLLEQSGAVLEKQRVAHIMSEFQAEFPDASTDSDCAICCESVYRTGAHGMLCCGKRVCLGCTEDDFESVVRSQSKGVTPKWKECPFCRHEVPKSEKEHKDLMKVLMKENKPWGLVAVADYHFERGNIMQGWVFMNRAAEQGFALAQLQMARIYFTGTRGYAVNIDKTAYWAKLAAEQGSAEGAYLYCQTLKGTKEEVLKWNTISAALGYPEAQYQLGHTYREGGLELVVSKEKALYWLRKAAEIGHSKAMSSLGGLLLDLSSERYGPESKFADHNPLVEVTFLMRRSSEHGKDGKTDAIGVISQLLEASSTDDQRHKENGGVGERGDTYEENKNSIDLLMTLGSDGVAAALGAIQFEKTWKKECERCGKQREDCPGGKLIRCKRCNICSYCSIQCLAEDWKARHKDDCIPEDDKKYNRAYKHTHF